ncbi:thiopeptide-type bacteriocin biosynthesis protein [Cytophagaceae bacterium ABcell3]|nr:thiopeptide-type bacteriocin biosynthesis protein [Cytophagaceae bacterium ABcell3]
MMEKYLSLHLFCPSEYQNQLLKEYTLPFVRNMEQEAFCSSWFFIRYHEGGAHIRLRLLSFAELHPKIISEACKRFSKTDFPVDVREQEYVPEIFRYGGGEPLALAEQQFNLSSATALQLISSQENWKYGHALEAAIPVQLSFAFALGADLKSTAEFFRKCYLSLNAFLPAEAAQIDVKFTFEKAFADQKSHLVPYVSALWQAMVDKETDEEWMQYWIDENKQIFCFYDDLLKKGAFYGQSGKSGSREDLWLTYFSLIHMSNNRLGVVNRDEAWIAYALWKSLSEL